MNDAENIIMRRWYDEYGRGNVREEPHVVEVRADERTAARLGLSVERVTEVRTKVLADANERLRTG